MKIKCNQCNTIIEGDGKGTFITCKCKAIYIDETEHYCRIGGKLEHMEEIKDEVEENEDKEGKSE